MLYAYLKGPPLEAYNAVVQTIRQRAMKELNLGPDQIIVRPMRPDDLGLTARWVKATGTTDAWVTYINAATVADNRFMGIYGVQDSLGYMSQLKINRGGSDARIWNIQPVFNFGDKVGYFDDPVTLDQNTQVTIEGYATTSGTSLLVLIGVIAERRGIVINP